MTKAGKPPPRRPPATRREAGPQREDATPTLNRSHIQGFVAGCMASLVVGIGIIKSGNEAPVALQNPESPPVEIETGPRFDFYTVLPNQELDLNSGIEPASLENTESDQTQYILQVGSFRQQDDADRRRGELALLGLEATIESGDSGEWYRVVVGPFDRRSDMARARSLAAQADMDTLLLRREAP